MAAKPRINLRFRQDLLDRIERLVESGAVKNLTAALEDGAELFLKRAERKAPREKPELPAERRLPKPAANGNGGATVHTDQKYVRPTVSEARRGVVPRPKGSSPTPKRKRSGG